MQQINLTYTSTKKKPENTFFKSFSLTLILSDLNLWNRAMSPLIKKYHQTINLGTVDLLSTFDILQRSSFLTFLDILDTYKVHRPSLGAINDLYQDRISTCTQSLKCSCLYLSVVIIKTYKVQKVPRKYLSFPKSFISNSRDNCSLRALISSLSSPVMIISSTYIIKHVI